MKTKKIISIFLVISLLFLVGCKKKNAVLEQRKEPITLNYYRVFEREENIKPILNKFEQANPGIKISYRNFTDIDKYLETILSELAEGKGPDLISVPNSWIAQNYKKISPAPFDLASPQAIRDVFVKVVEKDNIFIDIDGKEKVFGIPLFVDTLALYYNDEIFEKNLPELGKPPKTWESLNQIAQTLTLPSEDDQLIRSGLAIGTGEGILRSADIFSLMLIQNNIQIYDNNLTKFNFANNTKTKKTIDFYASFDSWDDQLGSQNEKEIYAFATRKTAMIFGYSYLYNEILSTIELAKRNGDKTINPKNVLITEAPQFKDSESPVYLANYYTETVTRNSQHPNESWKLITYLADPKNLETFYKNDFKPTSRRELINSQKNNSTYAPFINQLGAATSFPVFNLNEYNNVIKSALDNINQENNFNLRSILITAQDDLNKKLTSEGAFPPSKNKLSK